MQQHIFVITDRSKNKCLRCLNVQLVATAVGNYSQTVTNFIDCTQLFCIDVHAALNGLTYCGHTAITLLIYVMSYIHSTLPKPSPIQHCNGIFLYCGSFLLTSTAITSVLHCHVFYTDFQSVLAFQLIPLHFVFEIRY